jgi:hypothetical protein
MKIDNNIGEKLVLRQITDADSISRHTPMMQQYLPPVDDVQIAGKLRRKLRRSSDQLKCKVDPEALAHLS